MPVHNTRFIDALLKQPVDATPVWMMRQAGRYLPEYRKVREKAGDFLTLCKTPELACEVTLQPIERYPLDAAILFSDILVIPEAMGMPLHFVEGEGPKFEQPIQTNKDIDDLIVPDPQDKLNYVLEAIKLIQQSLHQHIPLIGFSGSPWTLATYMVEGQSSKDFRHIKKMLFTDPALLHQLLDKLAQSVSAYLNAQIAAGVNTVMLFDTWGGVLTTRDYQTFSLQYMQKIIQNLTREKEGQKIPVILFTKGGSNWLELMAQTGCDALGLDWTIDIGQARERVGDKVALQGNMDPCILYSNPKRIREEVKTILQSYGSGSGHVFNLGHGIHPTIDPDNVAAFIEAVHEAT